MSKTELNLEIENNKDLKKDMIDQMLKHKFFVTQVNYPPQSGFLEYGPVLTVLKNEMLNEWRKILIDENMFEIDTSVMVPYDVLKNSGHIDKFCDVILTDGVVTVRADHFIEEKVGEYHLVPEIVTDEILNRVDQIKSELFDNKYTILDKLKNINFKKDINKLKQFNDKIKTAICDLFECQTKNIADCSKEQIDFIVKTNNLTTDTSEFLPAKDFNLIFKLTDTQYMRPEVAQGIFTNFKKGYEFNNGQMPFAMYSIGKSYRNEISARGGMFRTKEFYQAEIEYFTEDGTHVDFKKYLKTELLLLPNSVTTPMKLTVEEAFAQRIITSEAIAVFLCRGKQFLINIGIDINTVRFRQHHCNEMAHYANDCWDIEILTLNGWIECAGFADRSNYDLTVHNKAINSYVKKSITPIKVKQLEIDKKSVIKELREKYNDFVDTVNNVPVSEFENKTEHLVTFNGKEYSCKVIEKTVEHTEYIPNVIEPSFGISRILYALLEQKITFFIDRKVLSLKPKLCFRHVGVTAIVFNDGANNIIERIVEDLKRDNCTFLVNRRNVSIGKKYLSCDEVGVPYFITVDSESIKNDTVTIRDRDTTDQIRVKADSVSKYIKQLVNEEITWSKLYSMNKF